MAVGLDSVKSVKPRPLAETWEALVEVLSVHVERDAKQDGNLWSPVTYHEGATRGSSISTRGNRATTSRAARPRCVQCGFLTIQLFSNSEYAERRPESIANLVDLLEEFFTPKLQTGLVIRDLHK